LATPNWAPTLHAVKEMATIRESQWAPTDESAHDLYVERLWFYGFQLGLIGYGFTLVLVGYAFKTLYSLRHRQPRFAYSFMVYVFVMFVLGTIGNTGNMKWFELGYVGNREFPGGPAAYFAEDGSFDTANLVSLTAYVVATWMQDGFLLYRFLGVFGFKQYMAIVPVCVYLLSIIMSCFLLAEITQNGADFFSANTVNFALGYWAGSIATTLLLTTLIVGKLLHIRRQLRKALGPSFDQKSTYVSISAMLIESASLYSAVAIAFIVLFSRNDPFQNIFLPLLGQVQIIAPLLIVVRVAQGRCFTQKSFEQTTTYMSSTRQPLSVHLQMDVIRSSSNPLATANGSITAIDKSDIEYGLSRDDEIAKLA